MDIEALAIHGSLSDALLGGRVWVESAKPSGHRRFIPKTINCCRHHFSEVSGPIETSRTKYTMERPVASGPAPLTPSSHVAPAMSHCYQAKCSWPIPKVC